MLSLDQLSQRISELAADRVAVGDFLNWFREASRDFHLWADNDLRTAIWDVESILSEYQFADLDAYGLKVELANAVRPFPPVYANSSGESSFFCTSGNNASCEFTRVEA